MYAHRVAILHCMSDSRVTRQFGHMVQRYSSATSIDKDEVAVRFSLFINSKHQPIKKSGCGREESSR